MDANNAACDCFSERPRATMVAAPRLARNASSDRLKLRWPRAALMVACAYFVPIRAETAEAPTPLARASPANCCFQDSKPAEVLPHWAAWAWGLRKARM